ncbi:PREDICTED: UPF0573 protein C2orf70 homolog [Nicrophorus vespilloides]|uniref:UPF0573 protein C2orf70 homolog n=1 Tax=Nicrophorus vespilloides TaxID=110193 RepID=A0ABM1NB65_NICVS|nr:PREDICTED: UPF0573 protein C2orf70 homolog [Nicrophorus vespilloides]
MGDINLSDMKATYFPPSIKPVFMGAHPPVKTGYGSLVDSSHITYFQNYRNENLSKFQMPPYEWGFMNTPYTPRPDIAVSSGKNNGKYLKLPQPQFTMLDPGRQQEIDDFYKVSQLHRDQYKDHSGRLHRLDYFKLNDYRFQCPTDPTSTYLKSPQYYVKYKDPIVLPITLDRSYRSPMLPNRALTGRYSPQSDISYKR